MPETDLIEHSHGSLETSRPQPLEQHRAVVEGLVAIVDLGGQYCHMIGRRLRDLGVESAVLSPSAATRDVLGTYAGVILSGGPQSVYDVHSPDIPVDALEIDRPILGICYGHQLLAKKLGCKIDTGRPEYGSATIERLRPNDPLLGSLPSVQTVWMSHGDEIKHYPADIIPIAQTSSCRVAAFRHRTRPLFGVQFHPEASHSIYGKDILRNFVRDICKIKGHASPRDRVAKLLDAVRAEANGRSVFFFVSGGVDSTVAFALCARALPSRVLGVYVDTGLMRKNETDELRQLFATLGLQDQLIIRDESKRFLSNLAGVVDPEEKRKIIGRLFLDVQQDTMREHKIGGSSWLLGQGTIYPDTVESGGASTTTALIKTHHNRCPEIQALIAEGLVLEPLRHFYKDEVRKIGEELQLDRRLTSRWPFPGPGLAIRTLCWAAGDQVAEPITLPKKYQNFVAIRIPLKTVGVQGDGRTYSQVAIIDRKPGSAPWSYDGLQALSTDLCQANKSVNRVVLHLGTNGVDWRRATVKNATITVDRLSLLREADAIAKSVLDARGLTASIWQFPTVLIPVGLQRGETIVLRPVNSEDGMTATFGRLPKDVLDTISHKILALPGIDMVVLDITDKPPGTIEWE